MRLPRPLALGCVLVMGAAAAAPAAMAAWSSAARVTAVDVTIVSNPAVVVDSQGRATAAWRGFVGGRYVVQAARYDGSSWSSPVTVSTSGRAAALPALGVDASGAVTLVWNEEPASGSTWALRAATIGPSDASWTSTTVDASAFIESSPGLAIDMQPNGDATVVYTRQVGSPRAWAVRRVAGTWKAPQQLEGTYNTPQVAVARTTDQKVVALWRANSKVSASTLTDASGDGTWSAASEINDGVGEADAFQATAAGSEVVATWGNVWTMVDPFPFPWIVRSVSRSLSLSTGRFVPGTGWREGASPASVSSDSSAGSSVPLDDGSMQYVYSVGSAMKTRNRAANGTFGTESTIATASGSIGSQASWVQPNGTAGAMWSTTSPVGTQATTLGPSGWAAPVAAPSGTNLAEAVAGTGGSAHRSVSVIVGRATVDAVQGMFATMEVTLTDQPPGAPTVGTVTLSGTSASVAFVAPGDDGGQAITRYDATCMSADGGTARSGTGAASPITVAELTAGATYTCTVTATNSVGTSSASSASAPVTVAAGTGATVTSPGTVAGPATTSVGGGTTPGRTRLSLASSPRPMWAAASGGPNQPPALVRTQVNAPGPGTISQTGTTGALPSQRRRELAARSTVACTGTAVVSKRGPASVSCMLTAQARAALRRGPLRLRLVTAFSGLDGSAAAATRVVVIGGTAKRDQRLAVTG